MAQKPNIQRSRSGPKTMQPGPKLGADLAAQLRDFLAQLRPQLGQPLLQLGVEAREIQLVQLAEIDSTLSEESVTP